MLERKPNLDREWLEDSRIAFAGDQILVSSLRFEACRLPTHSHPLKTPIKRKVFVCGLLHSSNKDLIIEYHWHCGGKNIHTQKTALGRGVKHWPGFWGKVCSTFSPLFQWSHSALCLVLQNQRSAHLFNVEINFHPVMLNLRNLV